MHPKTDQAVQLPKTESCWPARSPWSYPGLGGSPTASLSRNICCAFTWWESNRYSLLLCSLHLLCFYLVRIKLLFFVAVQSSFVVLLPGENQMDSCVFVAVQHSQTVRIKLLFCLCCCAALTNGENQTAILSLLLCSTHSVAASALRGALVSIL